MRYNGGEAAEIGAASQWATPRHAKRVMIVDDHEIILRGLRTLLDTRPELQIVAQATTGLGALEAARSSSPDIAIVDCSLPAPSGPTLVRELRKILPNLELIFFSECNNEDLVLALFQAGARGFVLKTDPASDLLAALNTVALRRPYLSLSVSEIVVEHTTRDTRVTGSALITPREREIVQLIAEGKLNKQVAHLLSITLKTVESHRRNTMIKIGARNTADLVRFAIRNNIVTL
jgi:DNA-binding NarL/FixJ family response regulator